MRTSLLKAWKQRCFVDRHSSIFKGLSIFRAEKYLRNQSASPFLRLKEKKAQVGEGERKPLASERFLCDS